MLSIIFIHILTIMSSIMPTIRSINDLPRSDHTKEMVSFIRHNEKLAKTIARSDFLLDCRRLDIMPNFITNRTTNVNKEHNEKIGKIVLKLEVTLRNEEIRSAFRTIAYLRRCLDRSASVLDQDSRWPWLYEQGRKIMEDELLQARQKLLKKLDRLLQDQKGEPLRPSSRLRLQLTTVGNNSQTPHQRTGVVVEGVGHLQQTGQPINVTDDGKIQSPNALELGSSAAR